MKMNSVDINNLFDHSILILNFVYHNCVEVIGKK